MFNGVFFHQTDIDVLDVEEVTHMEANLFFILLFIRAVIFSPHGDVFDFRNLHVVFIEDGQDVFVMKAFR